MMNPTQLLQILRRVPGVTRVRMPAGQVLHYAGHVPLGFFLLVKGSIELMPRANAHNGHPPQLLDAKFGFFLFPRPDLLNEPFDRIATIKKKAEFFFIPRSAVDVDPKIRRILEALA